jgi:hypothetical protein
MDQRRLLLSRQRESAGDIHFDRPKKFKKPIILPFPIFSN